MSEHLFCLDQVICGKTACNLLSFKDSQHSAVKAGAVEVLKQMCQLGDPAAERECSDAFFLISGNESYRKQIIQSKVLPVLILLAGSTNRFVTGTLLAAQRNRAETYCDCGISLSATEKLAGAAIESCATWRSTTRPGKPCYKLARSRLWSN